jgi:hypothetical protein
VNVSPLAITTAMVAVLAADRGVWRSFAFFCALLLPWCSAVPVPCQRGAPSCERSVRVRLFVAGVENGAETDIDCECRAVSIGI